MTDPLLRNGMSTTIKKSKTFHGLRKNIHGFDPYETMRSTTSTV